MLAAENSPAQTCTGVISDPTVVIDFGAGSVRTTPLPQMQSPYQLVNANCPNPGFYSVRNSTFQCFNNTWQVLPFDHTPNDANGNFLLVNALPGPSTVYVDTIHGLCSGRVFRFGAWIANVANPTQCTGPGSTPNLTFSIYSLAGVLLGEYTTGDIVGSQPATWINRNFLFDLPAGNNDVILKITDQSPAGCGNDFALDDLSFSPCSGDLRASFAASAFTELNVCQEAQPNYLISPIYSGISNPSFQWQVSTDEGFTYSNIPGATNINYTRTPTGPGIFYYRFVVADNGSTSCRFTSKAVKLEVYRAPFAQGTNYVFGCYGSTVLLGAAGGSYYHWSGPNGFVSDLENPSIPSVDFSDAGKYIVKVTNVLGCSSYDTTDLKITQAPTASVAVPAFTICQGQSVQLDANPNWRYKWTPPDSLSSDTIPNPIANPSKTTTYVVKVYNEVITCYDTATVKVIVWDKPHVEAGPDKFTYDQRPVILEGNVTGAGVSYVWSPNTWLDNPLAMRPRATPIQTSSYVLTAKSEHGCGIVSDTVEVKVIDSLLIPTAFTPNHDGLNDAWEIIAIGKFPDASVEVYNRWGQRVYASTAKNYQPWDGKFHGQPAEPGTYVFYLRTKKNAQVIKGLLHVIR